MKTKRLLSIKTRILIANISFVLLAFLGVIVIFNVLMDSYISSTATNQLARVVSYQNTALQDATAPVTTPPDLDNAPRGMFNTHPASFTINAKYEVQTVSSNVSTIDKEISKEIAQSLKNNGTTLNNLKDYRLETSTGTYYIETSKQSNGTYLLLYVDITGIVNFSRSVNLFLVFVALAVILVLAIAVAYVTRRLVRPLSRLANFATQIGKGDFTPCEDTFKDLEMATLADTMNAAAAQLASNDQDQKIFFQNASHELRTPLMAIKSYAEGISYDVIPPKDASKIILSETDRMSDLVEDLLTLSRLDNLNVQQEFMPYSLQELLNDVVLEQNALAEQKNLKLIEDFAKTPIIKSVNYKALRRAISNLVSNALRYAKTKITLSCQSENGKIILIVSNDGEMVSQKDLPHIFERFYKGNGGVHGIGLAIVKSIVEQHQGTIQVKSDEQLTQFIIVFEK